MGKIKRGRGRRREKKSIYNERKREKRNEGMGMGHKMRGFITFGVSMQKRVCGDIIRFSFSIILSLLFPIIFNYIKFLFSIF